MALILDIILPAAIDFENSNHEKLVFDSGHKKILVKESFSIGRQGDLRIKREFNDVSKIHCKIIDGIREWKLQDTSSNGTHISGMKEELHHAEIPLRKGMLFKISNIWGVMFEVHDI